MFKIQSSFSKNISEEFITTEEEILLRYNYFIGNVDMLDNISIIRMNWSWVPILDFSLSLISIKNILLKNDCQTQEFEFTESNEKIFFNRNIEGIEISTSFTDVILKPHFFEFENEVNDFFRRIILEIYNSNKNVRKNITFLKYLTQAKAIIS